MDVKEANEIQAAERLRRLANQSFSETDIEINVQYENSIKNCPKDRQ